MCDDTLLIEGKKFKLDAGEGLRGCCEEDENWLQKLRNAK